MARKSKKALRMDAAKNGDAGNGREPAPEKVPTALYMRLSKADADTGKDSMANQLQLLRAHVKDMEELEVVAELSDDGFSGTNFNRPAYEEMMEGVRSGVYRCVVVKDLSRLGRNYLETSDLLECEFPLYGCRFISVNDNIDTKYSQIDTILVGLKNIMNQKYAEDLSRKIKAAFKPKIENGDALGGKAPYGYLRDPKMKGRFVVDTEAAPVVQKIFRMKLGGLNDSDICRSLDAEGILCPSDYYGWKKTGVMPEPRGRWKADTVRTMTLNPVYLGHTVHGKFREKGYIGEPDKKTKRSEWVIYKNVNPPIVTQEVFDGVQEIRPLLAGSRREK